MSTSLTQLSKGGLRTQKYVYKKKTVIRRIVRPYGFFMLGGLCSLDLSQIHKGGLRTRH